jgi:folate-binding Fe-S cluster repair protein YgfZ
MNSKWQAYIERRGGHLEPSHRSVFYRDPEPPVTGLPANFVIPCSEEVVLSCTGKDTIEFLQSQLTCDLRNLSENQFLLGAYCNPKGRVLASLRLYRTAEAIQLVTHHSVADALLSRLRMYVLRADVMITLSEETAIMRVQHSDLTSHKERNLARFRAYWSPVDQMILPLAGPVFLPTPFHWDRITGHCCRYKKASLP